MLKGELCDICGEVREVGVLTTVLCRALYLFLQLFESCLRDLLILYALQKEDAEEITVKLVVKQLTSLSRG